MKAKFAPALISKNRIMQGLWFYVGCCFLLTFSIQGNAQTGVSVSAEVDKTAISTDEMLTLTLTVAGDFQQLGEPQLPILAGFNLVGSSRSSQFTMVNGVVTSRTAFVYRLYPTTSGTLTIDPLTIMVDGSNHQTERITIQVAQGPASTSTPASAGISGGPPPSGEAPSNLEGQDLYVEAEVDIPRPFVGQQIIYRFRLYQAISFINQPSLAWPGFSGFWTEDLVPNTVFEERINDRLYRVTEVRKALFPTAVGSYEIEPAVLTVPGDFFSREVALSTNNVLVEVLPLPPGAPDAFRGAVGQFDIRAWVEPVETRINDPVTLFVRISGEGNLTTLPDPTGIITRSASAWRLYAPQITTNVEQDGPVIRGDKLFERLLMPRLDGNLELPTFSLVFFDPQAKAYRNVETKPLVVAVAPDDSNTTDPQANGFQTQQVVLQASDIRHIKTAPSSLALRRRPILEQLFYWLAWVVPAVAVLLTWIWRRHRQRLFMNSGYARAQRARQVAHRRLLQAGKQARVNQDDAFSAVAQALSGYMGDKFNMPSAGLTRDTIRQILLNQKAPDALIHQTLACLEWADSGRFAPTPEGRNVEELIAQVESVIAQLENVVDANPE